MGIHCAKAAMLMVTMMEREALLLPEIESSWARDNEATQVYVGTKDH